MIRFIAIFFAAGLLAMLASPSRAEANVFEFLDGYAIGAGINQGTDNEARESWIIGLKARQRHWEYGFDIGNSEDFGGMGVNKFAFGWGAYIDDFQRPDWQDYGVYGGLGAGFFLNEDELVESPIGPFALLGWDFSPQAGLEGKVGYFGGNYWGTAMFYWYFGK